MHSVFGAFFNKMLLFIFMANLSNMFTETLFNHGNKHQGYHLLGKLMVDDGVKMYLNNQQKIQKVNTC